MQKYRQINVRSGHTQITTLTEHELESIKKWMKLKNIEIKDGILEEVCEYGYPFVRYIPVEE